MSFKCCARRWFVDVAARKKALGGADERRRKFEGAALESCF